MIAHSIQRRLRRENRAFTLVELLVVIAIITILASTALFAMFGVREDVREKRARAEVAKINELIMEKWESYRTRAIPVDLGAARDPGEAGWRRLYALRELMRMELPDRKSDLLFPEGLDDPITPSDNPAYLASRPTLWKTYIRRARQQLAARYAKDPDFQRLTPLEKSNAWKINDLPPKRQWWTLENQPAECLFLILAAIREDDTTGLDFFSENEIGDVDNDGMPEILDPWGSPIRFFRWAPGFRSDLQKGDLELSADGNAGPGNGDAFDPLHCDPRWQNGVGDDDPFFLFPLIYSLGRDRGDGIVGDFDDPTDPAWFFYYHLTDPPNDPYVRLFGGQQIGLQADLRVSDDNITNHFIEVR